MHRFLLPTRCNAVRLLRHKRDQDIRSARATLPQALSYQWSDQLTNHDSASVTVPYRRAYSVHPLYNLHTYLAQFQHRANFLASRLVKPPPSLLCNSKPPLLRAFTCFLLSCCSAILTSHSVRYASHLSPTRCKCRGTQSIKIGAWVHCVVSRIIFCSVAA